MANLVKLQGENRQLEQCVNASALVQFRFPWYDLGLVANNLIILMKVKETTVQCKINNGIKLTIKNNICIMVV